MYQEFHEASMGHQEITLEQQRAFGLLFGELHVHPTAPSPEGHPGIFEVHADENSHRIVGTDRHTDVSCDEGPRMGSILHLHTALEQGGETLFASMYAAYDAFSEEMSGFLGGLKAWHESEKLHRAVFGHRSDQLRDGADTYTKVLQPIIRTHSVTGRKGLCVNTAFTIRIKDHYKKKSDAIFSICSTPTTNPRNSAAASNGKKAQSPSGSTDASNTTPSWTSIRKSGPKTG